MRMYWNWHTCIPYALEHPRTVGVSARDESREDCLEGCLKCELYEGWIKLKISIVGDDPIDISEGGP